jgi:hypothetical protein
MGWDIGAHSAGDDPGAMQKVARVCAWWTLAAGVVVIIVRAWRFDHRWFLLTGAALLHVALHGLFGMSYLLAGFISGGLAAIAIVAVFLLGRLSRGPAT